MQRRVIVLKRKLNEILTGVWVEFGAIQCVGELFNALFVAVQFPVATDEKLPASHDCKSVAYTRKYLMLERDRRPPVEETARKFSPLEFI